MAKVLSQQEIDSLLTALSSGEIDAEEVQKEGEKHKVRPYDFRRPNKFSKEQIHSLEIIYENYARIASNSLSSQVRSNIKMKKVSIEQVTYEEFIRSIPNPTLLLNIKMPPLNGALLLEVNLQFAFQIIELLCGGGSGAPIGDRELTDIEKGIVRGMLDGFVRSMKEAWRDVVAVEPSLESVESNPQLNQMMSPTESVALVTFVLEVADVQSFANLCIPYLSIEKISDKLTGQSWFQGNDSEGNTEYAAALRDRIQSSGVNLSIFLGSTDIMVGDFLNLSEGDVLPLDKLTDEPLSMYVEDKMHFRVQPGIYDGKLAVQVTDIVEKDVDRDE